MRLNLLLVITLTFCKGTVSTILPRDSLQEMTDVHVYVDGMIPITYGPPI